MSESETANRGLASSENAQPFETGVLPEELEHLRKRRAGLGLWAPSAPAATPPAQQPQGAGNNSSQTPEERLVETKQNYSGAHQIRPLGLAFSGGGIRSATFNLGILQGLAEKGLLPYVDYLSTVSGGGYIGSWLHGLIQGPEYKGNPGKVAEALAPSENPLPDTPARDPISFLRKYSNYLAPKLGLFSPDLWVIGIIWLRNVLLNQLILVPAIMTVFLLLVLAGFLQQMTPGSLLHVWLPLAAAVLGLTFAGRLLAKHLKIIVKQTFREHVAKDRTQRRAERSGWLVPMMFLTALMLACTGIRTDPLARWLAGATIVLSFLLLQVRGGFRRCYKALHKNGKVPGLVSVLHVLWMSPLAAAVTFGLIRASWDWIDQASPWLVISFAPSMVCLSVIAGVSLLIGLMGADFPDAAREWTASTGATLAIWCAMWSGLFTLGIFGPWLVSKLLADYGAAGASAFAVWVMTTAGGVFVGRSAVSTAAGNGQGANRVFKLVASVAPTVFMIGYLLILAFAVHAILRALPAFQADVTTAAPNANFFDRHFRPIADQYEAVLNVRGATSEIGTLLSVTRTETVLALILLCAAICLIAASRFNINEFSLHHFYKNRLVRCYLGASNSRNRQPNALTGFDATDDIFISKLRPEEQPGIVTPTAVTPPYLGPYAIVNATLNLNTGSELATQERKSTSFVFTPNYCGFESFVSREDRQRAAEDSKLELYGYRATRGYSSPVGPSLGTAMAISGAAANPNSGYQTSGPMAFLLTVFDARLGWWLGNPRRRGPSQRSGPIFALRYLLAELFAKTDARSNFVNISDGGHFDNLGLYELVRRRCRYIIVGDGEQDGELTFGSLGGAIRKCRADFGVEIDLDPAPIRMVNGFSKVHCVVGTIRYPEDEAGIFAGVCETERPAQPNDKARGWLLYLKSSLTGDEPSDVIEYRSRCPQFPHESTGDQFFSESQFESYRRLGLHIVRDAFEDVPIGLNQNSHRDLLQVFQALAQKWYSPIPVSDEAASRLADAYSDLMRRLSEQQRLIDVFSDLMPGERQQKPAAKVDEVAFAFGLEVFQLMENVFTEFKLEHGLNRANPRNAGWMRTFRRWAACAPLQTIWSQARNDYNPVFQKFITHLSVNGDEDVPRRA